MYKPVSSKVDFPAMEKEILRFWEERQIFRQLVEHNRGHARYSFIDGPITANNPMGVHHAWGRTYKDIYQRFHAMRGEDQRYQNGFDCQGLWVEVEVERELGLNSKHQIEEYGLDRFAERCRARVLKYAQVITDQSVRLGQWMDWDNSYFTMSDNNIEHIWHFLKVCHERGWLYRGWRAMPWCARCGTSLSQHELIGTDSYREVTHPSVYVKLPLLDRPGEHFLVWTTTPWTLPANVALAVHPELDYARVEQDGEVYYLSAKTVERVLHLQPGAVAWPTVKGSELVGLPYRGPFDELNAQAEVEHRVQPWEDVGEDEGTGIVHIAPGCGAEDFTLGQVHGLPVIVPIDENGNYYDTFGPLSGRNVRAVTEDIFASLRGKNMLYRVEEIQHRYPTCWRCGEQIVFRAVSEWFISADEIRPLMIEAARTVEWTPPGAGKRMEDWLNNMQDWCISRKRYWGLPLPFYQCANCDSLSVIGSVEELRQRALVGMDQVQELHRPWIDAVRVACPECGQEVERISDVGDCWLDAGVVPFSTLGSGQLNDHAEWARWYPADWVSEMREQIRLWFYSMLFMSVALEGRAPYKRVLTYEKLMDEKGDPMHKSLGNAIWFEEAADRMGADVMRWLYAGQNLQSNLLFGYGPAEDVRRKLLTLWNVYSFFVTYANANNFVAARAETPASTNSMDRWIISQLHQLATITNKELESYNAAAVVDATDRFVDNLSTWYLRRGRRRFSRAAEPADRMTAFQTLHTCLVTLARLVAPFMPFLADEIYQNLVRATDEKAPESVHLTPYPEPDPSLIDAELDQEMALVRGIVTLGRAARAEAGLKVRQPLPAVSVACEVARVTISDSLQQEIADELNVKEVRIVDNVSGFARRVVRPNPRALGPRLGREFPTVSKALQDGTYSVQADGSVRVGEHTLTPDEVSVSLEPLENQAVAQDLQFEGGLAVALDRNLTPELEAEGKARELIHRVQTMRRDAGLTVEDKIVLWAQGSDDWHRVLSAHSSEIRDEIGAVTITVDGKHPLETTELKSFSWEGALDGDQIALQLRRVE